MPQFIGYRFQVSPSPSRFGGQAGFGCQGTEVLYPDTFEISMHAGDIDNKLSI